MLQNKVRGLIEKSREINSEVEEAEAVVRRSQAKQEQKVKSLEVTQTIDSKLSTEELSCLQREDETLKCWFDKAELSVSELDKQETKFEVRHGLL